MQGVMLILSWNNADDSHMFEWKIIVSLNRITLWNKFPQQVKNIWNNLLIRIVTQLKTAMG